MRGSPLPQRAPPSNGFMSAPRATQPSDAPTLPSLSGRRGAVWRRFLGGTRYSECALNCSAFRGGVRASFQQPGAEYALPCRWHLLCSLRRRRRTTAMPLPFTKEQFFDLFAAYNEALWPSRPEASIDVRMPSSSPERACSHRRARDPSAAVGFRRWAGRRSAGLGTGGPALLAAPRRAVFGGSSGRKKPWVARCRISGRGPA